MKVWDIFVCVSHWLVAVGFFVAFFTEDDLITLHVWAGYLVGALVVLRVLWGFVGPRHARFTDFVKGPRAVASYLGSLVAFRAPRYIGHSPAGGAMALALWIDMLAIVWSGLEVYALKDGRGPLAAAAPVMEAAIVSPARASEGEEEGSEQDGRSGGLWEEVYEVLADLVMALVVLHIAGVVLASLAHRENLARTMVTGRKRPE